MIRLALPGFVSPPLLLAPLLRLVLLVFVLITFVVVLVLVVVCLHQLSQELWQLSAVLHVKHLRVLAERVHHVVVAVTKVALGYAVCRRHLLDVLDNHVIHLVLVLRHDGVLHLRRWRWRYVYRLSPLEN